MAHHKSETHSAKSPKTKKVACAVCGQKEIPQRMKREPPERGPYVHDGDCRTTKRRRDAEGDHHE